MNKFTHLSKFVQNLFDEEEIARKAKPIIEGILRARSARMSDIAREMAGTEGRNYKCIQRFLEKASPQDTLMRLFQESASFVIGDPTEMPRPQAKKTDYVGTLSDGQTSGYWLLLLSTAFHGRSIPCGFVSYSSKTINQESTSRNRQHFEAFAKVKEIIGDRPLVLDREFSYLELMENLVFEELNFVIRLKVGPKFTDQEGKLVALTVAKGETRIINKVFYMGKVFVNLIGVWKEGLTQPMWIMTNLNAEDGLLIYLQRMKIEESFRDLKNLLGMDKLMLKHRDHMEKMVALLLIAYTISLWLGEALRETIFPKDSRKQKLYSGLFLFLKLKIDLSPPDVLRAISTALSSFNSCLIPVRSLV